MVASSGSRAGLAARRSVPIGGTPPRSGPIVASGPSGLPDSTMVTDSTSPTDPTVRTTRSAGCGAAKMFTLPIRGIRSTVSVFAGRVLSAAGAGAYSARMSMRAVSRPESRLADAGQLDQTHDPLPLPGPRREQLEHLGVGPARPSGQGVHDQVVQVVVADADRVRMAERALRRLGRRPRPDAGQRRAGRPARCRDRSARCARPRWPRPGSDAGGPPRRRAGASPRW